MKRRPQFYNDTFTSRDFPKEPEPFKRPVADLPSKAPGPSPLFANREEFKESEYKRTHCHRKSDEPLGHEWYQ